MGGVAGQQVGAQHEQAHTWLGRGAHAGKAIGLVCNAARHFRVINAEVGVFNGLGHRQPALPDLARPGCITVHEHAGQTLHVGIGPTEPVLQREEVEANVLGRTRNEAKNFRQPAQHLHLRGTRARGLAAATFGALVLTGPLAAKALEQGHGA